MTEVRIAPNSEFVQTKLVYFFNESQSLKKCQQSEYKRVANDAEGEGSSE
jgi:hypothetical protein